MGPIGALLLSLLRGEYGTTSAPLYFAKLHRTSRDPLEPQLFAACKLGYLNYASGCWMQLLISKVVRAELSLSSLKKVIEELRVNSDVMAQGLS